MLNFLNFCLAIVIKFPHLSPVHYLRLGCFLTVSWLSGTCHKIGNGLQHYLLSLQCLKSIFYAILLFFYFSQLTADNSNQKKVVMVTSDFGSLLDPHQGEVKQPCNPTQRRLNIAKPKDERIKTIFIHSRSL